MKKGQGKISKKKNTGKYTDVPTSVVPKSLIGKEFGVVYVFVRGTKRVRERRAKQLLAGLKELVKQLK